MKDDQQFYILSIDGGGIRGVFPAHILACIHERLDIDLVDKFDLISGTSTGAIVAAGIARKLEPKKIVNLYKDNGDEIFVRRKTPVPKKLQPAVNSIYDSEKLKGVLKKYLGELTLGQVAKPLLIPATNVGHGDVHVFKSGYSDEFTRDENVPLVDAVLASCSAPTFFDPTKVQEYLLADGGLWANNPSLAAVIDAKRRLGVDVENIKILSLGTGQARTSYGVNTDRAWGLMRGWRGPEFISFIMSLQAKSIHNYLQLLLRPDQFMRIDFESDLPLPLDDIKAVDDLVSRADREFTYRSEELRKFLI